MQTNNSHDSSDREKQIASNTANYIRNILDNEGSGHDWWHVYRVWKTSLNILEYENANVFVVELSALLHDIADWKLNQGDHEIGPKMAREWLQKLNVDPKDVKHICEIIADMSFKGAGVETRMKTIEGMIVQDADRLDAIGAIGIGRTFTYGGYKGRPMYDPEIPPQMHKSFEEYKKNTSPTINHFYEKLLLLKNSMNTETAKSLAEERHIFMETFLKRFMAEWEGKP